MAPKRKSEGAAKSGGKASKQTQLNFAKKPSPAAKQRTPSEAARPAAGGARPAPQQAAAELVLEERAVLPVLSRAATHSLDQVAAEYKTAWADKCAQLGVSGRGLAARDEVDLDGIGLRFLEVARQVFQQACRSGSVFPRPVLEVLVLMLRSDAVHKHPHVSRQAYSLLHAYLQLYPAVSVWRLEAGAYAGRPFAVTSVHRRPEFSQADPRDTSKHADNFWSSLETDLSSFSSRFLLTSDITVSGRIMRDCRDGVQEHRLDRSVQLGAAAPFELLLLLFQEAADSDKINRDGDLLLLRYLLAVLDQDLRCRLEVFAAYKDAAQDDAVQRRRKALLENSLLWRALDPQRVGNHERLRLTHVLMRLVSAAGGAVAGRGSVAAGGGSQETSEDLSQGDEEMAMAAASCIFTRQQRGAMAAQLLRMQLEAYGAMEDIQGFYCTSRIRSFNVNLRMQLDAAMLNCFWGMDGKRDYVVCRSAEASRAFLRCLPPRDRMRFLGMVVAQKFRRTYNDLEAKGWGLGRLTAAGELLENGGEAERYVDVDVLQAVQCINRDQSRAFKVYKDINLLAVVVAGISLTLHALAGSGGGALLGGAGEQGASPPLGGTAAELGGELHKALRGIVERSLDPKDSTCQLADATRMELVLAQMAVTALAP